MATETRVFESVGSTPEDKAANAEYFKAQGAEVNTEDSAATGDTKTPPATDTAAGAAAAPNGEDDGVEGVVDAETAADWESAQTDGKRKSRYAKERQQKRELKATNERLERELAELKAKGAAPAETKPGDKAPPAAGSEATPPAAAAPAATAADSFTEAEPAEPQYEDFAAEDDQLLAYQKALSKHHREWSRWDRKREKFEETRATQQAQATADANKARDQRMSKLNEEITAIRAVHADFDAIVKNGEPFSQAISGASTVIPGGLEVVYQLAKDPVKLKQFNEQTSETKEVNGKQVPTQRAWDLALFLLGQMAGSSAAPPASAPAGSPPAASPSTTQPREEPAAPRAARGRASDAPDRDQMSGDARRDMLAKQLG